MAESFSTSAETAKQRLSSSLPKLHYTDEARPTKATILLYAQARWGKTNIARTLPNVLVLATELGDTRGLQTLRDARIPYIPIDDWDTMARVVSELSRSATYEGQKFENIVIDSLTATGELWMEKGMSILGFTQLWDRASGKDPRNVYAYVAEKGRQGMKAFFDIPANLICLCREGVQEEGEKDNKIAYAAPELPGAKLPRELPGWPDATLRGVLINGTRVLQTGPVGRAIAGFRVPPSLAVPMYVNPDLGAVIELITGDATAALKKLTTKQPSASVHVPR